MPVPVESALSGSTNGRPIPVVATATPGTTLHTTGATGFEKVWLFVSNVTALAATLTVEWGGVSDPGDHLTKGYSIPANSPPMPIALGQIVQGGTLVRAFSSTASSLNITGFVIAVR